MSILKSRAMLVALAVVFIGSAFLAAQAVAGEEQGPVVKKILVKGCVTLLPDRVKAKMGTREGRPLVDRILAEDFKRIANMDSIADVQFKREEVKGGINILVLIREKNIIRRIIFEGNKQVNNGKLRELIKSKVGTRYDPGQVNSDRRAIADWYKGEYYYFADVEASSEPFEDGIRLVFTITEGGRLYVRDIKFRGNKHFKKKELLKFMETRPSTFFTRGKYQREIFERDLARIKIFYKRAGFLDVKVVERPFEITSNTPNSKWQRRDMYIHIDIVEGERYKVGNISFEGNKLVKSDDLRAVLETTPGEWYSEETIQADARRIRDIYGKSPNSRYFTIVRGKEQLTPEGPVMDVVFEVKEGDPVIVSIIDIHGNDKTAKRVILREVQQLPGEKVDSDKINETRRRLINLGYFKQETLIVDLKKGTKDNEGVLVIGVEEIPTGKFQFGAGVSSRENLVGSVQLTQRNFMASDWPKSLKDLISGNAFTGGGQYFNAEVGAGSSSQTYKVDWSEPWLFDRPVSLGLGASFKVWEYDVYDEERMAAYIRLGRKMPWIDHLYGSITYKPEQVTLTDFEDDEDVSDELRDEEGSNWISRLIFNLTYSTINNRFDPSKGVKISATQEVAGTILGGSKDFWRGFLEGQLFHPVYTDRSGRPWVIGIRGEIAAAEAFGDDEHVPVYEKLYAGGMGSVRGFKYRTISPKDEYGNEIGGELRSTAGVEFFFPIYDKILRGSLYYDIGSVWAQLDDRESDNWRSSCGLGLHVKTPLGPMPIRLYFNHSIDEEKGDDFQSFQFSFGANF